jgi:hypothetical protein
MFVLLHCRKRHLGIGVAVLAAGCTVFRKQSEFAAPDSNESNKYLLICGASATFTSNRRDMLQGLREPRVVSGEAEPHVLWVAT